MGVNSFSHCLTIGLNYDPASGKRESVGRLTERPEECSAADSRPQVEQLAVGKLLDFRHLLGRHYPCAGSGDFLAQQ